MPQDAVSELLRIKKERAARPPSPPPEKPWSVTGFVENAATDAFDILKGIASIFPTAGKAAYEILSDPKGLARLAQNPGILAQELKNTGVALKDAIIEPYRKHGFGVVYHKPMTALMDVLAVNGLLAKSAGAAGRVAGGTRGAFLPGRTTADKVVAFADKMERAPGAIARKAIDDAFYKFSGTKQDLPKGREFKANKREEAGRREAVIANDMELVGQKVQALSDPEAALFHEYRTMGGARARLDAVPKVKEALEAYTDLVKKVWQHELKNRRLLSEAQIKEALAKKYAWEKWGSDKGDDVARARVEIEELRKRGDVEPVYGPAIVEKKGPYNLEDFLTIPQPASRIGKVGFLEAFRGAKGAELDPRKYVPRAIRAFRDVETRLRLVERTLETPGLTTPRPGGAVATGKPLSSQGVFQKYFEDRVRAEAIMGISDPTIKRLLAWEFYKPGEPVAGLLRLYDKVLGVFRMTGTTLNPSWYTGQVIGDAILSTLGGSDWIRARDFLARKRLPPEVAAKIGMAPGGTWLESAAQIGNSVDQAARAGIFTKALAQEMKLAGVSFEASASVMEKVIAGALDFRQAQVEMRLLKEQVTRGSEAVRRLDGAIGKLVERERIWAAKLEAQIGVQTSPREAIILERLKRLQSGQAELLQRLGLGRAEAKAALKELHRLALKMPPEEVSKLAMGIRKDILTPPLVEEIAAGMRQQFELGKELRTLREKASAAKAAAKESIASRAGQVRQAEAVLEGIRQKIVNLGSAREQIARELVDNAVKQGALDARMPTLRQQSQLVRDAAERANAFTGDYLGLDGFGQGVLRRIVPFYPWVRAMTMLAFRLPFLAPVKAFFWHRYAMAAMTMVGDPELPEWLSGYVPVFARENGDLVWISLGRYSPFNSLRLSHFGGVPIPNILAVHEQNPVISTAYQMGGGKTIFQKSPLPYGEQMVMIGNGDVYEFKENGKIEKVIPQTPLISGIAHMFPITQFLQDIIFPFVVTKHNWVGLPQAQLNPDGSYKYPREWWQRLASLGGVRTIQRSPESAKRSERIRVIQAVRGLIRSYKRADEEERQYMKGALEDYMRGEYRRIDTQ